ncbi:MAG TPA: DoxX family protein [Bacteroidota bacterium]|nr:DoxX family protein [Bacteroidota bacterium]
MALIRRLASTDAPGAVILIRLVVGGTFLSEGIQKFLFAADLGVGRFIKIGIPWPEFTAPFVGVCEILCGALLLIGLLTRAASLVMTINILVAIATTKVPLLLSKGFWTFAHEARVDCAMLLGSLFLLIAGAGGVSLDARSHRRERADEATL